MTKPMTKSTKYMTNKKKFRLPNGFGSIVRRDDGNRRKPFEVRKSVDGKQKTLGFFATYEEAIGFLVDYNKNPSLFTPQLITFSEVYNLMAGERFKKLAKATTANYKAVYKYCHKLYSKRFTEVTIQDLQNVIHVMSEQGVKYASQKKCRQLMHHMYTYAVKYKYIKPSEDISGYVEIDNKVITYKKSPFNTRQLNRVKKLANSSEPLAPCAMCVVMMCYSGPRPTEFISVLKQDVKLKQRYFIIRESKTEAGRNRAVPIHKKTLPYFELWMSRQGKYLIGDDNGDKLTYHRFRNMFDKVMQETRCNHTPHECRHTCATMLDNVNANETATKRILGHSVQGITKGVYTHKDLHQLKKAIDLLR